MILVSKLRAQSPAFSANRAGFQANGSCVFALCAILFALGAMAEEASGQANVQVAHLWGETTSLTIGLRYEWAIGSESLVEGTEDEFVPTPWTLTAMAGFGLGVPNSGVCDTCPTAVAHLGVFYETGCSVERVGIVGYGNLEPLAGGPAVRATVKTVVETMVGGLYVKGGAWVLALGVDVELQSLLDLGR